MEPLYLSFLWHMHQPYYKNLYTGEYLLPWVLLHGTKDYCDMALLLRQFEGLKQNFNVVPSLLVQMTDYETGNARDRYLEIFRKEPRDLSRDEKAFLLNNFFNANWENMIRPFPRYYELLAKRGFYYPKEGIGGIIDYFSYDDLRDIQILFFLSWIDPVFIESYDGLKSLVSKGRRFSEEDKKVVEDAQRHILQSTVPLYKELAASGAMEVSTSPFYHPIVPLLIDSRSAREAMPYVDLPEMLFARPEDGAAQIEEAVRLFTRYFGSAPKGMWPPEGSVSDGALELYMKSGISWIATDEEILFQSLHVDLRRDGNGFLLDPEILYKPFKYEKDGRSLHMVFRDKSLSDLISFHYSRMAPKEAAEDCIRRIRRIGESVRGRISAPLVTIAMDGENAWEHYKNDGRDFLQFLYEGILKESAISPVTISEYLERAPDSGALPHCFAGSWIGHNFAIWIGHVEDNTGWTLLSMTREFLEKEDPGKNNREAWESIYIAEGSDWFWWYGDEHSSENDEVFDFLFRENLANVYRFLGKEPPDILNIPILLEDREVRSDREPINYIYPIVDGRVTNYFDWMGAGFIEGKGHGMAMHEAEAVIKGCYYGFNEKSLFLRVDVSQSFIPDLKDLSFEISLMTKEVHKLVYRVKGDAVEGSLPVRTAFSEILEMEVPFDAFGAKRGDKITIWISLKIKEMIVDRIPKRGYLSVAVPSENFEMEMWYV
ncbi:MAG TPA: glycoside hydrolase family 57 protein [Syntrophorhabdaceae bacterium]|jgi:alpha-amylase/alpha-mannosidase (GH57 family)